MEEAANLSKHLSSKETALLTAQLEDTLVSMYPFLKNPMASDNPLPFHVTSEGHHPGLKRNCDYFWQVTFSIRPTPHR